MNALQCSVEEERYARIQLEVIIVLVELGSLAKTAKQVRVSTFSLIYLIWLALMWHS